MKDFVAIILLCSLRLSVLVLLFSIILKLLGSKITAGVRYTIWRVLALIAVIPINFKSALININSSQYVSNTADIPSEAEGIITDAAIQKSSIDIWQVLFVLWLVGSLIFLIYHVIKNFAAISLIKRWRFSDENIEELFAQVKSELDIRSNVKFYRSKTISGPISFGLRNHTVAIPCEEYSNEELTLIFKHELTHISRRDSLFKLIVMFAASIHWFNPFVYLFLYQFNAECELSCDEKITANCISEDVFKYGELILNSAAKSCNYFELYTSMAVKNSMLKLRLEKIICGRAKKNVVLCAAVLAILITSALVMQCTVGYAKSAVIEYKSGLSPTDDVENISDGTKYQETIHTTVTVPAEQSTKNTTVTTRQDTHSAKQYDSRKKSTAKTTARTTTVSSIEHTTWSTSEVNDTTVKSSAYNTQPTQSVNTTTIKPVESTSAATHGGANTAASSAVNTTTTKIATYSTTTTVTVHS